VNAAQRTASILYLDTGIRDVASLLELDPHGGRDPSAAMEVTPAGHAFGVHRGDFVFIHKDGTTNGFDKPRLPYIGELEAWVRESHVTTEGMITGWREEMSEIGRSIASRRVVDTVEGQVKRLRKGDWSLSWFGEVLEVGCNNTYHEHGWHLIIPSDHSYDLMGR
jgi:ubiquitin-conjugating enzyme E2 O